MGGCSRCMERSLWEFSPPLLAGPIVPDPRCLPNIPTTSVQLNLLKANTEQTNRGGGIVENRCRGVRAWCESVLNDATVGELITTTALIGSNNLCD